MITAKDQFIHGVDGVKEFEVRLMTADDAIGALEDAIVNEGSEVTSLRVRQYEMARMLTVSGRSVTVEQVKGMLAMDYDIANTAAVGLEKKLRELASQTPAGSKAAASPATR